MKYLILLILNFIDYLTTIYLTSMYGLECELNPLMRSALSTPWIFAVIKLVMFPALVFWMYKTKKDDAAYVAIGMFLVIVLLNVYQLILVLSI